MSFDADQTAADVMKAKRVGRRKAAVESLAWLPAGMTLDQFDAAAEKLLAVPAFAAWVEEGLRVLNAPAPVYMSAKNVYVRGVQS